jgi:hypothetical protein
VTRASSSSRRASNRSSDTPSGTDTPRSSQVSRQRR